MKKALLTGSTGGIGSEVAALLARDGWDLVLLNRNKEQAALQAQALQSSFPNQKFDRFTINLMDIENIREVSDNIVAAHPQINALYNIAGLLTDERIMSKQNLEGHFAINTVAPYMLIKMLMSQLKAGATTNQPAIIVNFSSEVVNKVKTLDVTKLPTPEIIGGLMGAYAKTKLAVNIMDCSMKNALLQDHIYIYSIDPGATKTPMTSGNKGMPFVVRLIAPILFNSADKQAKKLVNAIGEAVTSKRSGLFISNGKVKDQPPLAENSNLQKELCELLEQYL
ncbi:MAG: SDR family NAD(P)-dependent oxidoreductase [Pseudomonadota bacterium]